MTSLNLWISLLNSSALSVEAEKFPMFINSSELNIFRSHHDSFSNVDTLAGDLSALIEYDRDGKEFRVNVGNKTSSWRTGQEEEALKDLLSFFK